MEIIIAIIAVLVILWIAYLPTIFAFQKKRDNRWQVLIINALLGWTFIGWVVALVMAVGKTK